MTSEERSDMIELIALMTIATQEFDLQKETREALLEKYSLPKPTTGDAFSEYVQKLRKAK